MHLCHCFWSICKIYPMYFASILHYCFTVIPEWPVVKIFVTSVRRGRRDIVLKLDILKNKSPVSPEKCVFHFPLHHFLSAHSPFVAKTCELVAMWKALVRESPFLTTGFGRLRNKYTSSFLLCNHNYPRELDGQTGKDQRYRPSLPKQTAAAQYLCASGEDRVIRRSAVQRHW